MSLRDEMPTQAPVYANTYSNYGKQIEKSLELQAQIDEFLANGGKVNQCKTGEAAHPEGIIQNEFNGQPLNTTLREKAKKGSFNHTTKNCELIPTALDNIFRLGNDYVIKFGGRIIQKRFTDFTSAMKALEYRHNQMRFKNR